MNNPAQASDYPALDAAIARAEVDNDPMGLALSALREHLTEFGGMSRQLVAGVQAASKPVRDEDLRRAVIAGVSTHTGDVVKAMHWRTIAIGAAVWLLSMMTAAGGGYWYANAIAERRVVEIRSTINTALTGDAAATWANLIKMNGVHVVNNQRGCEPQGGGLACTYVLWTKLPAPQ